MHKKISRLKYIALYLALPILASPVHAEIFRWIDKQGQIHFSDADNLPEQVRDAETVDVEPNVVETQPGLTASRKTPKKQKITKKYNKINKKPDIITQRERDQVKCRLARKNLDKVRQRLRAGYTARQYRRLHDREIRYMDDRHRYCH